MKECFLGAKEIHPDIFRGGHRNPYYLEMQQKVVGQLHISIHYRPLIMSQKVTSR